jgi:hypothetical protein
MAVVSGVLDQQVGSNALGDVLHFEEVAARD